MTDPLDGASAPSPAAPDCPIVPYRDTADSPTVRFADYDPQAPQAAAVVCELIARHLPEVTVEHVGSTAVPGCAGKGVVDLLIAVEADQRERVAVALLALGFQRQSGGNLRPLMLEGAVPFDGKLFKLHVHVAPAGDEDTIAMRRLRDLLRADPALCAEYAALKRAIVARGVTERVDYTRAKSPFIERVLQRPVGK